MVIMIILEIEINKILIMGIVIMINVQKNFALQLTFQTFCIFSL